MRSIKFNVARETLHFLSSDAKFVSKLAFDIQYFDTTASMYLLLQLINFVFAEEKYMASCLLFMTSSRYLKTQAKNKLKLKEENLC